jgi:hypothetical protein
LPLQDPRLGVLLEVVLQNLLLLILLLELIQCCNEALGCTLTFHTLLCILAFFFICVPIHVPPPPMDKLILGIEFTLGIRCIPMPIVIGIKQLWFRIKRLNVTGQITLHHMRSVNSTSTVGELNWEIQRSVCDRQHRLMVAGEMSPQRLNHLSGKKKKRCKLTSGCMAMIENNETMENGFELFSNSATAKQQA